MSLLFSEPILLSNGKWMRIVERNAYYIIITNA